MERGVVAYSKMKRQKPKSFSYECREYELEGLGFEECLY